jgi:hypothetical protein
MGADDQLVVTTDDGSLTFTGYQYLDQPDITSIMHQGVNYITLQTNDLIYGYVGLSVDVWIRAQSLGENNGNENLENVLATQRFSNQSAMNQRNQTSGL